MKWTVIGISGVTNGGKSSLCQKLLGHFPGSIVIGQDQFFREVDDPAHVWIDLPTKRHQNWELYSSVNWEKYENAVKTVLSTEPAPGSSGILFIEGHIIYNHKPFKALFDERFFLTLTEEECRMRRSKRNYVPADPPSYFDTVVWSMSVKNRADFESFHKDGEIVYIDGTQTREEIVNFVVSEIETVLARKNA